MTILSAQEIVRALSRERSNFQDAVLAFDGDGTLWAGDVGEDVFNYATLRELLRDEARDALALEARGHGIDESGSPSVLARRLFDAYIAGKYPERSVCAAMTWCYAGFTRGELAELIERAFEEKQLASRVTRELEPVFEFARSAGLRTVLVSASPEPVVELAARLWGIGPGDVAAARPACEGTRILPRLEQPVPYAEAKLSALSALVPNAELLASFGDNIFDAELLGAARLGVAVRPKPALEARLHELPGVVRLEMLYPAPAAPGVR